VTWFWAYFGHAAVHYCNAARQDAFNKVAFCILNVKQEKIARDHSQQVMTCGNGGDACRIERRRRDSQQVMTSVESRDGDGTPVRAVLGKRAVSESCLENSLESNSTRMTLASVSFQLFHDMFHDMFDC
jgi:hypothetical protein